MAHRAQTPGPAGCVTWPSPHSPQCEHGHCSHHPVPLRPDNPVQDRTYEGVRLPVHGALQSHAGDTCLGQHDPDSRGKVSGGCVGPGDGGGWVPASRAGFLLTLQPGDWEPRQSEGLEASEPPQRVLASLRTGSSPPVARTLLSRLPERSHLCNWPGASLPPGRPCSEPAEARSSLPGPASQGLGGCERGQATFLGTGQGRQSLPGAASPSARQGQGPETCRGPSTGRRPRRQQLWRDPSLPRTASWSWGTCAALGLNQTWNQRVWAGLTLGEGRRALSCRPAWPLTLVCGQQCGGSAASRG